VVSYLLLQGDARRLPIDPAEIDAIVTDPPYGIDFGRSGGFVASHGWSTARESCEWDKVRPKREGIYFGNVPTVIWGGNYFADYLPPSMGWLVWDKGQTDFSLADFEMAWTSKQKASRRLVYHRANAIPDGKFHPTQKPVAVMAWAIRYLDLKPNSLIVDPYMGSGSTAIAAMQEGHRFIGLDLHRTYVEIAKRRLERPHAPIPRPDRRASHDLPGQMIAPFLEDRDGEP
jgi:DNA modification methylase